MSYNYRTRLTSKGTAIFYQAESSKTKHNCKTCECKIMIVNEGNLVVK